MVRRSKIRAIFLLPLCAILYAVGWASYRAGSQNKVGQKAINKAKEKNAVDMKFGVLPPEDLEITAE